MMMIIIIIMKIITEILPDFNFMITRHVTVKLQVYYCKCQPFLLGQLMRAGKVNLHRE